MENTVNLQFLTWQSTNLKLRKYKIGLLLPVLRLRIRCDSHFVFLTLVFYVSFCILFDDVNYKNVTFSESNTLFGEQ